MFVLHPDGKNSSGGLSSPFYSSLSFFGRMALYFAGIRLAYVFFGDRSEQQKAITN
jgi:hypothetical protein